MKGLIEFLCDSFVIGLVGTVVPLTIYSIVTDRRKGDSWKTILNRYF